MTNYHITRSFGSCSNLNRSYISTLRTESMKNNTFFDMTNYQSTLTQLLDQSALKDVIESSNSLNPLETTNMIGEFTIVEIMRTMEVCVIGQNITRSINI